MDLGSIAKSIGGAIGKGAKHVGKGFANVTKASENIKSMDAGEKSALLGQISSATSGLGDSGGSNVELHPMAQAAMNLDMGFYGHMDTTKISRGKPIMGGQNAVKKRK